MSPKPNKIAVLVTSCTESTLLNRIPKSFGKTPIVQYVISNHSPNPSSEIMDSLGVHVIRVGDHDGTGVVNKKGVEHVLEKDEYHFIIMIDADGQYDPAQITSMLDLLSSGASIVSCSRFHWRTANPEMSLEQTLMSQLFAGLVSDMTGWVLSDARTGCMGFRASLLRAVIPKMITANEFSMELILRSRDMFPMAKYREVPNYVSMEEGLADEHAPVSVQAVFDSLNMILKDLAVSVTYLASMRAGRLPGGSRNMEYVYKPEYGTPK